MENILINLQRHLTKCKTQAYLHPRRSARVIEISEQVPAPIRATVGKDAEELLRAVHEKSDEELDIMKAQIFGFAKIK